MEAGIIVANRRPPWTGNKWSSLADAGFFEHWPCYVLGTEEQVASATSLRRLWTSAA
jgi:hypothetical protein